MDALSLILMFIAISGVIFLFVSIRQMITVDLLGDGISGRMRVFLPYWGLPASFILLIKMMQIESIIGTFIVLAIAIGIDV